MFNVKCNFRGIYNNLNCRFNCLEEETQQHILNCDKIREKIDLNVQDVEYNYLFSSVKKQKKIVEVFEKINKVLEEYPI